MFNLGHTLIWFVIKSNTFLLMWDYSIKYTAFYNNFVHLLLYMVNHFWLNIFIQGSIYNKLVSCIASYLGCLDNLSAQLFTLKPDWLLEPQDHPAAPSLIRIKNFKRIVPGRFLVTFGHMNTLQKELNCVVVGKSHTWSLLILTAPFMTKKKNSSAYWKKQFSNGQILSYKKKHLLTFWKIFNTGDFDRQISPWIQYNTRSLE